MLGNSQTFLGVLTTIIVLCVFLASSSNLLFNILKPTEDDIRAKLDNLLENYKDILQADKKTNGLKNRVVGICNLVRTKEADDGKLYDKALKLLDEIAVSTQRYENNLTRYKQIFDIVSNTVMSAKELILAPLYTFLFCLAVFVFNEVWGLDRIDSKFMGISLYSFLLISTIFWILVWIYFWNRTNVKNVPLFPGRTGVSAIPAEKIFLGKLAIFKTGISIGMFILPVYITTVLSSYDKFVGWLVGIFALIILVTCFFVKSQFIRSRQKNGNKNQCTWGYLCNLVVYLAKNKIIVSELMYFSLFIIVAFFHENIREHKLLTLSILIGMSIPSLGIWRLSYFNKQFVNYSTLFILSHFVCFLIISIIYPLLLYFCFECFMPDNIPVFGLKTWALLFALFNGLMCPFVFPLMSLLRCGNQLINTFKKQFNDYETGLTNYRKKAEEILDEFIKTLPTSSQQ